MSSGVPVQRCTSCGRHWFPERLACPACGSFELDAAVAVEGVVEEVTLLRRAPGRTLDVPVRLATVRLAEGPRLVARLAADEEPGATVRLDLVDGAPVAS
jgi:uncharacterized protein